MEFKTTINGVYHHLSPHRLVAEYFVPGRTKEKNMVHHIDANPKNNVYTNLMWVTQDFNVKQEEMGFDRNKKKKQIYIKMVYSLRSLNHKKKLVDMFNHLDFQNLA